MVLRWFFSCVSLILFHSVLSHLQREDFLVGKGIQVVLHTSNVQRSWEGKACNSVDLAFLYNLQDGDFSSCNTERNLYETHQKGFITS